MRGGRRRRWAVLGVAAGAWLNVLALCAAFGVACSNVELGWKHAGPARLSTRHPAAPGALAQERDETHWLVGRGFVATVQMQVTALDFGAPGSDMKSSVLAWYTAEETLPSWLPTLGGASSVGRFKMPAWFPVHAWAGTTVLAVGCLIVALGVRRACANEPVG